MSALGCSAFAVLTPPGRGGIAVLRCVGPAAEAALQECFRPAARGRKPRHHDAGGMPTAPLPSACSQVADACPRKDGVGMPPGGTGRASLPPPGHLAYGHIIDAGGRPLDEIILCSLPAPCFAPAEGAAGDSAQPPIFEVNCHGGPAAVAAVAERLVALGLEQVDADRLLGLEGAPRIERDARRMLRTARTALAARVLLDQLGGALAGAVARILEQLASNRVDEALAEIGTLLARWRHAGRFLADPPRVVIAGRPNVGKSTLLNRLVGADRAITSAAPGTTRDYVEVEAALDGVPVVLVDTAGLGEARDEIEGLGVERARGEVSRASLVVYLLDACEGAAADDEAALRLLGERGLAVWNKADLVAHAPETAPQSAASGTLRISALSGDGIAALMAEVLARLGYRPTGPGEAVPVTREQAEALRGALESVEVGDAAAARLALAALAEGHGFCIAKSPP